MMYGSTSTEVSPRDHVVLVEDSLLRWHRVLCFDHTVRCMLMYCTALRRMPGTDTLCCYCVGLT